MAEVAGDAAIFVDPDSVEAMAEGISTLMEDQSLRDDMIAKGHARVQQFSWRAAAEHTLAVYREAAESH